MSIRAKAKLAEEAALELARRGRGLIGRRERQTGKVIGAFVGEALNTPPGGVLPVEVRDELKSRIERTIEALETYVSRVGARTSRRTLGDTGVVQQIYALREAEQQLLQTEHFHQISSRPGR